MEANIVTIVLPLIGGGIGYYLKHLIEKRKDLVSEVNKERRELYQKFINLVVDIFKGAKKPNPKHDKLISELYDFYKKYILYASPAVINRFWDYFQYLYKQELGSEDHRLQLRKSTSIMTALRSDLGLKNRKLGKDGIYILRARLTDLIQ